MGRKVIDAKQACCYETLAASIRDAIPTVRPGEVLEVVINPGRSAI